MKNILLGICLTVSGFSVAQQPAIKPDSQTMNQIDDKVYDVTGIDVKPLYPGGIEKFYADFKQHLTGKTLKAGKLYLMFIIEKDGTLSDIKCVRSTVGISGPEAVAIAEKLPRWSPGSINRKVVRTLNTAVIEIEAQKQ